MGGRRKKRRSLRFWRFWRCKYLPFLSPFRRLQEDGMTRSGGAGRSGSQGLVSVNEWSQPSDRQDDGAAQSKMYMLVEGERADKEMDECDNEFGILCLGQGTTNQTHKESTVCLMSEKKTNTAQEEHIDDVKEQGRCDCDGGSHRLRSQLARYEVRVIRYVARCRLQSKWG